MRTRRRPRSFQREENHEPTVPCPDEEAAVTGSSPTDDAGAGGVSSTTMRSLSSVVVIERE
jgi:hypothetical protein